MSYPETPLRRSPGRPWSPRGICARRGGRPRLIYNAYPKLPPCRRNTLDARQHVPFLILSSNLSSTTLTSPFISFRSQLKRLVSKHGKEKTRFSLVPPDTRGAVSRPESGPSCSSLASRKNGHGRSISDEIQGDDRNTIAIIQELAIRISLRLRQARGRPPQSNSASLTLVRGESGATNHAACRDSIYIRHRGRAQIFHITPVSCKVYIALHVPICPPASKRKGGYE